MSPRCQTLAIAYLCCLACFGPDRPAQASALVINELVAATSDRLLQWDITGTPHLGTGPDWYHPDYQPTSWKTGVTPIGYVRDGLVTDIREEMEFATPSLYLRTEFPLSTEQARSVQDLVVTVNYDDGFILFLNGRELVRHNMGPHGMMIYADQPAFNRRFRITNEVISLPGMGRHLREGRNVLAAQVHSTWTSTGPAPPDGALLFEACLTPANAPSLPLVPTGSTWSYFVGHGEPSGGLIDPSLPTVSTNELIFHDWVELHNEGATPIALADWSLSDDAGNPRKWIFPDITIAPHGYLVIHCSGLDRRNPSEPLHASFQLDQAGEHLGLYNPGQEPVSAFNQVFPPQDPFHSYGKDPRTGGYVYFSSPSPQRVNTGPTFEAITDPPEFSVPGGFHDGPVAVQLSSGAAQTSFRYTLDGTEPTEWNGLDYHERIVLFTNATLRARSFRPNWIPSEVSTATYLIDSPAPVRSLPAVVLSGDPRRTFFADAGILAVHGGLYFNDAWYFLSPHDYNMVRTHGRPYERPASLELFFPDDPGRNRQIDAGVRTAGSDHSRHRIQTADLEATMWVESLHKKPSLSLFFRDDYDGALSMDLFPGHDITDFGELRLRSGNNDWANPFIRDETVRRLHINMGHKGSRGILVNLFINAHHKSYFNLVERIREPFFQATHKSTNRWDVRFVVDITEGDAARWNQDFAFIKNTSMNVLTNYAEAARRFDLVNVVDYLLLNIYSATWDWPQNNYFAARERTDSAAWRFYAWDAEGTFGYNVGRDPTYNSITNDLPPGLPDIDAGTALPILFRALKESPEFRILFADRIQKHLFNDGALTSSSVLSNYNSLATELNPVMEMITATPVEADYMAGWTAHRPSNLLQHCLAEGLWTGIPAPILSQNGGTVPHGYELTIYTPTNTSGTLYYTRDGTDPRLPGGDIAGEIGSGPILLTTNTTLNTRLLTPEGWGPLLQAGFTITNTPPPLAITEIHYNPAGTTPLEFIEIKNLGPTIIALHDVAFTEGISFSFPNDATLGPGEFALLVEDRTPFEARYPGVAVAGVFSGSLRNSGETVRLSFRGKQIFSVDYLDEPPWPLLADGSDYSLVPREGSNADPDSPLHWRASTYRGGSPGADDPVASIPPVIINEICPCPQAFPGWMIELYNPTDARVDLGGWSLSDNRTNATQYRFPPNTFIEAQRYLVLNQSQIPPGPGALSLSPEGGLLTLTAGNSFTNQTGYTSILTYEAHPRGITSGAYLDPQGNSTFLPLASPTLGSANSGPKTGPIVINEIMYHPTPGHYEYVELLNAGPTTVSFLHPLNSLLTWKLDGLGFNVPTDLQLAPGELAVVTEVDPPTFRTRYDIPPQVRVLGPWSGSADNNGENLTITQPVILDLNYVSNSVDIPTDQVRYNDKAPWPESADGRGQSLQRLNPNALGQNPSNWNGGTPSPGRPNQPPTPITPAIHLAASGGTWNTTTNTPLAIRLLPLNIDPAGITLARFLANNIEFGQDSLPPFEAAWSPANTGPHTLSAIATLGNNSSITSPVVSAHVLPSLPASPIELIAPRIVQTPAHTTAPVGSPAGLRVTAFGQPLSFQWYREDNTPVPNATADSLVWEQVAPADAGGYHVVVSNELGQAQSPTAQLQVLEPDSDNDGMADYWESRHGFNPFLDTDAFEDSDGDGLLNALEFIKQTHPRQIDFHLATLPVEDDEGAEAILLLLTIPGNTAVTVESSEQLGATSWQPMVALPAQPATRMEELLLDVSHGGRFFRLVTHD